jgi:hypothetical protein
MATFTAQDRTDIIKIAVGVWGAAPGYSTLNDLAAHYRAGGTTLELVEMLVANDIFINEYPAAMTDEEMVTKLVDTMVGGLVAQEDFEWAVDALMAELNAGASFAEVILIAGNALAAVDPEENAAWANAHLAFLNRVEVAEYFSWDLQKDAATLADLRAVLDGVDHTEAGLQQGIDNADGATAEPPQTFTLTANIDVLTGGAGNDVFNAPLTISGGNTVNTLGGFDELYGGGGTDRLNATLVDDAGAPILDSIERLWIRSRHDDAELSLSGANAVEQLWNDRSTNDLTITGASSVVLGLNQVMAGTTYDVTFASRSGVQTIVTQGAGTAAAAVNVQVNTAAAAAANVTSLALVAAGGSANNIALDTGFNNVGTLTITGSAPLTLATDNDLANANVVTATGYTGNLTLDMTGNALGENLNVNLGGGNNRLLIDGAVAGTTGAAINLGGGTNTLNVGALQDYNLENVAIAGSTVQILEFNASTAADIDLDGFSGVTTVQFRGTLNVDADMVIENGPSSLTFTAQAAIAGDLGGEEIDFGDTQSLTMITSGVAGVSAGSINDITIAGDNLTSVTMVAVAGDIGGAGTVVLESDSVTTLTLMDSSTGATTGRSFELDLVGTESLTTINASTLKADSSVVIFADIADYSSAVSVYIGGAVRLDANGDVAAMTEVQYWADVDNSIREIFKFVGNDIGDVIIDGFAAGVLGSHDRLDFSAFAGVTGLDDLNVEVTGGGDFILTSDGFTGSITLTNVNGDPTDDAANFIF